MNRNIGVGTMSLENFIANCHVAPDASCKLSDFIRAFRRSLDAADAHHWPRSRILLEVARRFPVGIVGKTVAIGGLALSAPQPASWQVDDQTGRLALV